MVMVTGLGVYTCECVSVSVCETVDTCERVCVCERSRQLVGTGISKHIPDYKLACICDTHSLHVSENTCIPVANLVGLQLLLSPRPLH